MVSNTREQRKVALKEDVKNLLEELWDAEEEEIFYKIFIRETSKGFHKVLYHSKEEFRELSYREDYRTFYNLEKH